MALGQCSITVFLAQDIFGEEVHRIFRTGGDYHCYNVIVDCVLDLANEQFGEGYFANKEQKLRYEYLKAEQQKKLCGK